MLKAVIDGIEYEMPENIVVLSGPVITLYKHPNERICHFLNGKIDTLLGDTYPFKYQCKDGDSIRINPVIFMQVNKYMPLEQFEKLKSFI